MKAMKIFHIKTNGFCDFLRFSIHFPFGRHFSMNLHKETIILHFANLHKEVELYRQIQMPNINVNYRCQIYMFLFLQGGDIARSK